MFEFDLTLVILLISFLVFIGLMNQFFYKPIKQVRDEREEYISSNHSSAKSSLGIASSNREKKETMLKDTRAEGGEIIANFSEKANEEKNSKVQNANQNFKEETEKFKNKLNEEKAQLKSEIKSEILEVSNIVVSKILGKEVSITSVNDEVIERVIKQL